MQPSSGRCQAERAGRTLAPPSRGRSVNRHARSSRVAAPLISCRAIRTTIFAVSVLSRAPPGARRRSAVPSWFSDATASTRNRSKTFVLVESFHPVPMRRTAALQLCGLLAVGPALGFTPSSFPLDVIRSRETGPRLVAWPSPGLGLHIQGLGALREGPSRPGVGCRQFPVPTFASATQDLEAPATEGSQQELSRFSVVRPRYLGEMHARHSVADLGRGRN